MGSAQGQGQIFLSNASTAHSLIQSQGRTQTQEVIITTVDLFCREQGIPRIDVLKIDTEGYDLEVLKGARELLASGKVAYVMTEVGLDPRKLEFVQFESIRDFLFGLGFEVFGIYDQTTGWGECRSLLFADAIFVHRSAPWR